MTTVDALTAADIHTIVTDRLNSWDQHIRVDIGINGCRLHIAELGAGMYIEFVAVPPQIRRHGYGTAILSALTGWADRNGLRLELGVSTEYGMRRATLERLYRKHGFATVNRCGGMVRPTSASKC